MIVKTEAVVVKRMDYRDTSLIVNLLTREFGRLTVIAKGARDPRNRLGPLLDSMNHLQVVLYKKEGRDLHLVTQCASLQRFPQLTTDLARLGCSLSILELGYTVSEAEEESTALFSSVVDALGAIDRGENPTSVLLLFESRLLSLLGFRPDLFRCVCCGAAMRLRGGGTKITSFRLRSDGIVCHQCRDAGGLGAFEIHPDSLEALQDLQDLTLGEGEHLRGYPPGLFRESRNALRYLLRTHVEGVRKLKSEEVLAALL